MKGNTSNKDTKNTPVNHFKESNITSPMGRHIFVIEEKVLLNFFTVPLIVFLN